MSQRDTAIHLFAGGVAGTMGAIATCPLEVVKTRLQSSTANFNMKVCVPPIASADGGAGNVTCKTISRGQRRHISTGPPRWSTTQMLAIASRCADPTTAPRMGLVQCIRHIMDHEGPRALFKGLGPNIVGVAPSRAIYFCSYSQSKGFFNSILTPDTPIVHICSASCAGTCYYLYPVRYLDIRGVSRSSS
ncbi:hypothetical protein B566_EDAN013399 [Ephemera danica]|nr:hypothetical protein B566_EDAN013399 [Ephemera danica]